MSLRTIYSYLDKDCAFIKYVMEKESKRRALDRYKNLCYIYNGGGRMVIRKVQKINRSYYVIINKSFLRALKLKRGDYIKMYLEDKKICIEKLEEQKKK